MVNIISTDSYNMGTVRLLERWNGKGKTRPPFGTLIRAYAYAEAETACRPGRCDIACLDPAVFDRQRSRHQTNHDPPVGLKDGILLDIAEDLSKSMGPWRMEQVWESALDMGRKDQFKEVFDLNLEMD